MNTDTLTQGILDTIKEEFGEKILNEYKDIFIGIAKDVIACQVQILNATEEEKKAEYRRNLEYIALNIENIARQKGMQLKTSLIKSIAKVISLLIKGIMMAI